MDQTRALLDELMGKDRNAPPSQKGTKEPHFSDPEMCKHFICGFCPSELFTNTKSDLGTCTKVHDENCQKQFQESPKKYHYPYEREFVQYLERLTEDLDKRIKKGKERLDTQDEEIPLSADSAARIKGVEEKIQTLLKKIEHLGEEGKVDESQQLMKVIDQLKAEKEQVILQNEARVVSSQEKRMRVCEICGAFLVIGDTEKRISSHLEGKQHQGFDLIRKTLAQYKATRPELFEVRDDRRSRNRDYPSRSSERRDRERDRDRDRDRDRERDRDRDRERDRDDYYRKRDRERERGRDSRDRKRDRREY